MTVEFWYEVGSTYTYLSVQRIDQVLEQNGVTVEWKPFLMMAIQSELGQKEPPFVEGHPKFEYMWSDLERRAKKLRIAYQKPSLYPPNTLLDARIACLGVAEGWVKDYTKAIFQMHWQHDIAIGSEESQRKALGTLGLGYADTLEKAQATDNKNALRQLTEEARSKGLFGSPSFYVDGQLFWGDDRLEEVLDFCLQAK